MPPLGLPPVTPELKAISPFLQRADELVRKEPVISYWCAYCAAQIGISLKAKDNASRNLLFELLGALEKLKADIGPNDAVDVEAASIAYVENFALKVFRMADDEDRDGTATRSTAKKFLAAANFFELLKVFPKADQSEAVEGKIKYAKWKAADIAKAFREGRKPAPGPPGSRTDPIVTFPPAEWPEVDVIVASMPTDPSAASPRTPPRTSPGVSPKRITPPPQMTPGDITKANQPHIPPSLHPMAPSTGDDAAISPGRWSTAATPGYDGAQPPQLGAPTNEIDMPSNGTRQKPSSHKARISWEMEGTDAGTSGSPREGRYSPTAGIAPNGHVANVPAFSSLNDRPDVVVPTAPPLPLASPSTSTSSPKKSPSVRGGLPEGPPLPPPSAPSPPSPRQSLRRPDNMHPSPPQTSLPEVESPVGFSLTPAIIAKAQKHCRFAISSLDYEDAEQARRELRAALAALGG